MSSPSTDDSKEITCSCVGCMALIFTVIVVCLVISLWGPLTDFLSRWLESH